MFVVSMSRLAKLKQCDSSTCVVCIETAHDYEFVYASHSVMFGAPDIDPTHSNMVWCLLSMSG